MHQFADNASSYVQDVEESVTGYIKEYRQEIQERDYIINIMILSLWKEKKIKIFKLINSIPTIYL